MKNYEDFGSLKNPYIVKGGCLYRRKRTAAGVVDILLANYSAEIIFEITRDNGVEFSEFYLIGGDLAEKKQLPPIMVTAQEFFSMSWLHKWGAQAIIEPGTLNKRYVRNYIQINSRPEIVTIFTHTGWREINGQNIFLSASGALGSDGVNVDLSPESQRYSLPLEVENEAEAIKASLSFLDVGKREITYPLFALLYLSPLTSILNPMPNFTGYLYGDTGVFKTTLAMLALCHFGDFSTVYNLPTPEDTIASIRKKAFVLKDVLMLLDDYCPSPCRKDMNRKTSLVQRTISEYAYRTALGEEGGGCPERARHSPRGMLLITGEDLVSVDSAPASVAAMKVAGGDIDKKKLTALQNKSKLLPHAMASFIFWVQNNFGALQKLFSDRFPELMNQFNAEGHGAYSEQNAFLTFSLETVFSWTADKGLTTGSETARMAVEAGSILHGEAQNR